MPPPAQMPEPNFASGSKKFMASNPASVIFTSTMKLLHNPSPLISAITAKKITARASGTRIPSILNLRGGLILFFQDTHELDVGSDPRDDEIDARLLQSLQPRLASRLPHRVDVERLVQQNF